MQDTQNRNESAADFRKMSMQHQAGTVPLKHKQSIDSTFTTDTTFSIVSSNTPFQKKGVHTMMKPHKPVILDIDA